MNADEESMVMIVGDRDKEKYRKLLMRYTKSDIIDVVLDQFNWEFSVRSYLHDLHDREFKRALEREQEESKAYDAAVKEYGQWMDTLRARYGEGEKISMDMLTKEERNRTLSIMRKMHSADEKVNKSSNRVDCVLDRMDSLYREG